MSAPPGRLRSVALLGGGTALAAVFGLLFQALLSYHFGAGAETDAWFMSLSIYAFLGKFLMLSNVKSLALPVHRRLQASEPASAARLERRLLLWLGVGTGALSALVVLGAPVLVDALAPGYDGSQRDLTVALVRIRTPALAFLAVSTGGLVALEAAHRFGVTVTAQKLAPAVVSLALLAWMADRFGMVGVGWAGLAGGVAGGLVALVAMAHLLRPGGPAPSAEGARLADRELRGIGRQWLGFGGSNAATFAGEWAFRIAASLLPVGLFSAVLYGRMVHDLLHAAVNDSAQTVSLPRFAAAAASAQGSAGSAQGSPAARVGEQLREGLGTLAAATLPLAAFVAVTAPWSVALLFGRGRFLADGMLGPSAVSLQLFAVAFLVQGLVQLLFSAAFASGRSELVNRVQIAGHLVRAAVLVPAVMAFSYVGLVGAQVAMNLLVLGLLVAFSPREWRLRPFQALEGMAGPGARGALVATAVATALHMAVASRLPEPLSVGTAGRVAVLAAAGVGWLAVYGVLALALGVPALRRLAARIRPAGVAVLLLAAWGAATPPGAAAQQVGGALLPADHWSRAVLEMLEARGLTPVGASSAGPPEGSRVDRVLAAAGGARSAPWAGEALRVLRWEAAGPGTLGFAGAAEAGASSARDWPRGRDGVWAGAAARVGGGRLFAHMAAEAGPGRGAHALVRGGVGVRFGRFALHAGREHVQLGGGASGALALSSLVPLDGLLVTTPEPFDAPVLGPVALTAGVFPMRRYEAVDDPWFALLRVAVHPVPWLEVGVSRAALVGGHFPGGSVPWDPKSYGPDAGSMEPGDVVGILLGRVTGFDDQVNALDVRTSLARAGLPVLAYGEMALEDKDRSWGDGAVLAGVLLAPPSRVPVSFRYEYAAFGDPARWCAWCDTLPAFWYNHARFQSGWRVGNELLGHPLGGYGLQHLVGVTAFDASLRLHLEVVVGRLRRDRWNLLEDRRPGWATWARARGRVRWSRGLELRGEGAWERGDAGWAAGFLRVSLAHLLGPPGPRREAPAPAAR
ncbi:MAG TPA: lipid II flippase MurJ [Longimicrobiales bacterium]|nr:lipid II flippase MurJ [Longimicrobiales bacterium]